MKLKIYLPLIVLFTLTLSIFINVLFKDGFNHLFLEHDKFRADASVGSENLIDTSGCQIPQMYEKGHDIDKFMKHNVNPNCRLKWKLTLPLITSNLSSLILNKSVIATLNIKLNDPSFKCHYTPIKRMMTKDVRGTLKYNDDNVRLGVNTYFTHDITVPHEMVEVICTLNEKQIYLDYHIFLRPRRSNISANDRKINLLVLGLDSVSRINFRRQMQKSTRFLSQLGNIEMLGYNKVEDNTFPNLIPVLTGFSVDELKNQCWPKQNDHFDKCHFVWDDFKKANFNTVFIEDSPKISLFNYLKSGFSNKPTDHYLRPIMIQAEKTSGHARYLNTNCCTGAKLTLAKLLDYTFKTTKSMANKLYMNFAWSTSLTHDYVEFPYYGDDDLRRFFVQLHESGELNRTIVILMSDHGMRWGKYRNTYQGSLEDRLPMLRFVVPEWFEKAYPKATDNLKKNTVRLTTPFDLHETLLDLVDTKVLDDASIERREAEVKNRNARGKSMFLEISGQRTCENAGIPIHYCACRNSMTTLAVGDKYVIEAAKVLVERLNFKLSMYPVCSKLSLHRINSAVVFDGRLPMVKYYAVTVVTVPGFASFEATVRKNQSHFETTDSVSRLNSYGNQSICVNDAKIKLFCYCIH